MFCADARLMALGRGPLGSGAPVPVAVAGLFSGGARVLCRVLGVLGGAGLGRSLRSGGKMTVGLSGLMLASVGIDRQNSPLLNNGGRMRWRSKLSPF